MSVDGNMDLFVFFSSRRRHTRLQGDWSSDVCSSDLQVQRVVARLVQVAAVEPQRLLLRGLPHVALLALPRSRVLGRSEERRVGKSVDLGGRRIIKKKKKTNRSW